jgi:hypothetical protein
MTLNSERWCIDNRICRIFPIGDPIGHRPVIMGADADFHTPAYKNKLPISGGSRVGGIGLEPTT